MTPANDLLQKAARLHGQGKVDEALAIYERLLGKTIQDPYILFVTASCYSQLKMHGTAMNLLFRAINLADKDKSPWLAHAWNNLGVCMRQEAHEEEAISAYQNALDLDPKMVSAWGNLCGAYVNYGDPKTGIQIARKALQLDPFNAQAGHHLGMMLLEDGQYAEGWRWYGSRMRIPEFTRRKYDCPMWWGEPVAGVLAIHGEQGIGDEILFGALLAEAMKRAGRVVLECTERLIPVFERTFGIKCYPTHQALVDAEHVDAWTAMGCLPNVFKVYEPRQNSAYLKASAGRVDHWKRELGPGFKIGLSWRGGTRSTHEELRNFEVELWQKLIAARPDANWVSVQYGDWEKERSKLGIGNPKPESFDDHLALVAACDLVVTICNTTVHEAGALGVPANVIVPSKPAWRYGMRGTRMLFYHPGVVMHRQNIKEPWSDFIERCRNDLCQLPRAEQAAA